MRYRTLAKGFLGSRFKRPSSRSHPLIVEPYYLTLLGVHGRVSPANLYGQEPTIVIFGLETIATVEQ